MEHPATMWGYWRDKYGHVGAMKDYYEELLASNPNLQQAVAMIENGERLLDSIMQEHADEEIDDEYDD